MSELKHYYSDENSERGIMDSMNTKDDVTFDDSYIISGELTANNVYATYDLFVIGDLTAKKIEIHGSLFVNGNITSDTLSCSGNLNCDGEIKAKEVFVNGFTYATAITGNAITASQDVVIRDTIDANDIQVDGALIACDGILGEGKMFADYAIGNNFVEFCGEKQGCVYDLSKDLSEKYNAGEENGTYVEEPQELVKYCDGDKNDINIDVYEQLDKELNEICALEEDEFLKELKNINDKLPNIDITESLVSRIIGLSYLNKVTNLRDLLWILMAKLEFPDAIQKYDTIDCVLSQLYEEALTYASDLEYQADNVEDIAVSLLIVEKHSSDMPLPTDVIEDRIFSSIGLKYSTVIRLLKGGK